MGRGGAGKEEGWRNAVVEGRMACRGIILLVAAAVADEARGRRRFMMMRQRGRTKERQCIRARLGVA